MNHKERFFATINHQPVDRPASWIGLPVPSAEPALISYFRVGSIDELRIAIDDDIYPIEVPYNYPPSNHIACAFNFAKRNHLDTPDERTLTAPVFFEDYSEVTDVDKFAWPDPAKFLDREESGRRVASAPGDRIKMGILWSCHFQDACAAFGMEQALMVMLANEMDAPNLKNHFAGKVAFCGGVDAQNLLVNGKPEEVEQKVAELRELFPTGLIISPSHEAILPDIAPANIEALFRGLKQQSLQ